MYRITLPNFDAAHSRFQGARKKSSTWTSGPRTRTPLTESRGQQYNIESTLGSESTVYKYTDPKRRDSSENSAILLELVRARDKPSVLTFVSRAAGAVHKTR